MSHPLTGPIEAYFQAANAFDTDAAIVCFAETAIVQDEGEEHHGSDSIRKWIDAATAKYHPHAEITSTSEIDGAVVVAALVSGSFEGSPAEIEYHFTLNGSKIVRLAIQ